MAGCKKKSFDSEWEARVWLTEHPWPEPSPSLFIVPCHNGKHLHITDRMPGSNGNNRRKNGKKRR